MLVACVTLFEVGSGQSKIKRKGIEPKAPRKSD